MYSPRRRALSTSHFTKKESPTPAPAHVATIAPSFVPRSDVSSAAAEGTCRVAVWTGVCVCAEKSGENRSRPRGCKKSRDEKRLKILRPGSLFSRRPFGTLGGNARVDGFLRAAARPRRTVRTARAPSGRVVSRTSRSSLERVPHALSRRPGRPRANSSAAPGRRQLTRVPSSEEEALRGNRARRRGVVKRRGRWRRSRRAFSPSS